MGRWYGIKINFEKIKRDLNEHLEVLHIYFLILLPIVVILFIIAVSSALINSMIPFNPIISLLIIFLIIVLFFLPYFLINRDYNLKYNSKVSWYVKPKPWFYIALGITIGMVFLSFLVPNILFYNRPISFQLASNNINISNTNCTDKGGYTEYVKDVEIGCHFLFYNQSSYNNEYVYIYIDYLKHESGKVIPFTDGPISASFSPNGRYDFTFVPNLTGDFTMQIILKSKDEKKEISIANQDIIIHDRLEAESHKQTRINIMGALIFFSLATVPISIKAFRDLCENK